MTRQLAWFISWVIILAPTLLFTTIYTITILTGGVR